MSDASAIIVAQMINSAVLLVGTLVAYRIGRGQMKASSIIINRQNWMTQFREDVATLITVQTQFIRFVSTYTSTDKEQVRTLSEINYKLSIPYYRLKLLVGEKGEDYKSFLPTLDEFTKDPKSVNDIMDWATAVLKTELSLIEAGE